MASSPCAPAVKAASGRLLHAALPPSLSSSAVAVARRAPAAAGGGSARRGVALVAAAAAPADDVRPAIDEWPGNFSHLSYADLRAYLQSQITTAGEMSPTARLMDVMSGPVLVATPGQRLAEVDAFFAAQQYSGLPVVDEDSRCVGAISKKDTAKAPNGIETTVGQVMSSPPITLTFDKTVLEAAALMLKDKIHRIPVVNEQQQVIGIVTRTDVFRGLEAKKA